MFHPFPCNKSLSFWFTTGTWERKQTCTNSEHGEETAKNTSVIHRQMALSDQPKLWVTEVLPHWLLREQWKCLWPSVITTTTHPTLSSTVKMVAGCVSHCVFAGNDRKSHAHPTRGSDALESAAWTRGYVWSTMCPGSLLLGWKPTATLRPQQGCVSVCSDLA